MGIGKNIAGSAAESKEWAAVSIMRGGNDCQRHGI